MWDGTLDLHTQELADHLAAAPAGAKTITAEVEVRDSAANTRRLSLQFPITARPQAYEGQDTPTSLPSPDDYLSARTVRHDIAQSLSVTRQAQARENINAASSPPTTGLHIHAQGTWWPYYEYTIENVTRVALAANINLETGTFQVNSNPTLVVGSGNAVYYNVPDDAVNLEYSITGAEFNDNTKIRIPDGQVLHTLSIDNSEFVGSGKLNVFGKNLSLVMISAIGLNDISFIDDIETLEEIIVNQSNASTSPRANNKPNLRVYHLFSSATLPPDLAGLTNLEELMTGGIGLTEFPSIAGLTNLEYVKFDNHQLTSSQVDEWILSIEPTEYNYSVVLDLTSQSNIYTPSIQAQDAITTLVNYYNWTITYTES